MKLFNVFVRRYSVSKSVVESFKEVKLMRAGKKRKPTLEELFNNIDKWTEKNK
jgi:hypothetical protein